MPHTADTSRDLLFGLLALQNGLIDQDQLVIAFRTWTRDKGRALADHLVDRGDLDVDDRAAVDALVARHIRKHGGDVEESLAAVPAARSIRGGLADLGDPDLGATLGRVGSAHPPTHLDDDDPDRTASLAVGPPTSDGQRFRVLRPHARGGLGAVFVALDSELNREVALKQILDRHADDPDSRARFLLEAEVTGRLEHPGVVPVYGLGRDAQGHPFYAMRFVKGQSLKEAIDRFHAAGVTGDPGRWNLELRQLLGRFVAVCNVVAYAHSRGVIHRDLKPANILLGPYGETLVVDWGLAKVVGRSEAAARSGAAEATLEPGPGSGPSETLPGTALGTPAYMSPEQAEGRLERVGPLSDVYSLGATLYCLLTGSPPIDESNVGEALRRVQRGDFPPPRAVRPGIPPGLEAIGLKAMALEPEERYPSARALADEIEHWLADEPVSVYREPFTVRLTRWGRRHRMVASSLGVLLVTAAVGLAIATALIRGEQLRTERQRQIAEDGAEVLRRKDYISRVNLALSECLDNHAARALDLLAGCPEDLRHWEYSYVERQCHLDLATFREPTGQSVNGVAFSPDGTRVASVSGAYDFDRPELKGDLVVRDVATGRETFSRRGVPSGYRGVAFSPPDGRWIAAGNASDLVIWDTETGEKRTLHQADTGNANEPLLSLAYSPDGRRIIAGYGGTSTDTTVIGHAILWDVATGKQFGDGFPEYSGPVRSVAFSPDGREVALASEGLVEVRGLDTGKPVILQVRGHVGSVEAVAYSPDGRYLASGGFDRSVRLWERVTGKEVRAFYGHESLVSGLAFGREGQWLISASEDNSLKLWEVASGRSLAAFHGHQNQVRCVAFSPDGRYLASGGVDHTVKLWLATSSSRVTLTGHNGMLFGVAFSPDSQFIASGGSPGSLRDNVMLWDATTGVPSVTFAEECPPVTAVAFRRDTRRLATACRDGTVRIWDTNTGRLVRTLPRQTDEVAAVAYGPDGRYLASATTNLFNPPAYVREPGEVKLWDADTGREIRALGGHTAGVFDVAFSPDGRYLASACADKIVRIWDITDPSREARPLPEHKGHVRRVVFLPPDGRCLATAGGMAFTMPGGIPVPFGEVKIWDLATGQVLHDLHGHTDRIRGLASSPDGRRLATASDDRTIKLWDTTTGQEVFTLRGHTSGVLSVAFSPDGRRIVSGSIDGTAMVWDTTAPTAGALLGRKAGSWAKPPELPDNPFVP